MNYKRYSIGNLDLSMWIECTDCGTRDNPHYVWQIRDRSANFELPVGAVMQHEIAVHNSITSPRRKR